MKPSTEKQQVATQEFLPFVQELLSQSGAASVRMTVTGRSMLPILRDRRDSVLLTNERAPQKYDIVLFTRTNGEAVLHRIIKKRADGFYIIGDNECEPEGPVDPSQIIAVVKGFYRDDCFVDCNRRLCRLYAFLWCRLLPLRRPLLPLVLRCGRLVKRFERMGTKHEMDRKKI